jgi:hypothetical protein
MYCGAICIFHAPAAADRSMGIVGGTAKKVFAALALIVYGWQIIHTPASERGNGKYIEARQSRFPRSKGVRRGDFLVSLFARGSQTVFQQPAVGGTHGVVGVTLFRHITSRYCQQQQEKRVEIVNSGYFP